MNRIATSNHCFDVCIVGSGPAGAFAAHELAQKGYSIAVIEAGGKTMDTDPANVIDKETGSIDGSIKFGFSQQVGGSSNLWAGGIVRFNPVDLAARPDFGFPGWPIDFSELELYYKRVDAYFGIQKKEHVDSKLLECITEQTAIDPRETVLLEPPYATGPLVQNVKSIKLYENCPAHKLIWNEQRSSIQEIEFYDRKTRCHRRVRAHNFVLAAGALTNIRLLLYSLVERKELLAKVYDQIGCEFSTHPKANIGRIQLAKPLPWNHPFVMFNRHETYGARYQFGLNEKLLVEQGLLNHCLRFDSSRHRRLYLMFERSGNFVMQLPLIRKGRGKLSEIVTQFGIWTHRLLEKMKGNSSSWLTVRIFLDQASRSENRVMLSSQRSESGLPLAVINWKYTEEDWCNAEAFIECFSTELNRLKIGKLIYQRPEPKEFTTIHSHFLGGTRMGNDPDQSVVDVNLKVHGIDNLYVSGPSVFPSYGHANPFYTIAALSLRLGDHLAAKSGNNIENIVAAEGVV